MSLKFELTTFSKALEAASLKEYETSLNLFQTIADTSKVQWNMGIILASMGKHQEAVDRFKEAVAMDEWLVIGWFQKGVSWVVSSQGDIRT
jgi:neutrophil factor 2